MTRIRWIIVVASLVLVVAGWRLLRLPPPEELIAGDYHTAEASRFRFADHPAVPATVTNDFDAIAELVSSLRSAVATHEHACASRGSINLRRSFGRTLEFRYLPGHNEERYEFRYNGNIYRVPRHPFVAAMRRLGIEVPLRPE